MSWHLGRLAAFDLETTGVDYHSDRIVTASVSLVGGGLPTESQNWLVNPGVDIPAGATAVHGVTNEMAQAEGRPPPEAVEEITAVLSAQIQSGVPVVAFNARYDMTIIDSEARRYGIEPLVDRVGGPSEMLVVDPLVIDKHFHQFRKGKRQLVDVCQHYGIDLGDAHNAEADALAAGRVAWKLGQTFAELAALEPRALHEQQILWAADQAASLQEYFRSQGRDDQVEQAWPIAPERATNTVE